MVMRTLATAPLAIDLRSFELPWVPEIDAAAVAPSPVLERSSQTVESHHAAVHDAWIRVVGNWQDQALHDALLGLAAEHRTFAWVATQYRERTPDAIADRQLDRLRRIVTAVMLATATPRPETERNPLTKMVLVVIAVVMLATAGGACITSIHHKLLPAAPTAVSM